MSAHPCTTSATSPTAADLLEDFQLDHRRSLNVIQFADLIEQLGVLAATVPISVGTLDRIDAHVRLSLASALAGSQPAVSSTVQGDVPELVF